jgi:HPt (histidine-containing phosphotransfer) domain-containing protein
LSSQSDLDREFLEELIDGDQAFAVELFETYRESADVAVAEAKRLIEAGDVENGFRPFHTLKGASASVGLTGVQELARNLEAKARDGDLAACHEQLGELERAVAEAKVSLQRYLDSF